MNSYYYHYYTTVQFTGWDGIYYSIGIINTTSLHPLQAGMRYIVRIGIKNTIYIHHCTVYCLGWDIYIIINITPTKWNSLSATIHD